MLILSLGISSTYLKDVSIAASYLYSILKMSLLLFLLFIYLCDIVTTLEIFPA
jgi:hypothetical protein